jgi:hypothetical protein
MILNYNYLMEYLRRLVGLWKYSNCWKRDGKSGQGGGKTADSVEMQDLINVWTGNFTATSRGDLSLPHSAAGKCAVAFPARRSSASSFVAG